GCPPAGRPVRLGDAHSTVAPWDSHAKIGAIITYSDVSSLRCPAPAWGGRGPPIVYCARAPRPRSPVETPRMTPTSGPLVLMYHGIGDRTRQADPDNLFVSPDALRDQIAGLRRRGWRPRR